MTIIDKLLIPAPGKPEDGLGAWSAPALAADNLVRAAANYQYRIAELGRRWQECKRAHDALGRLGHTSDLVSFEQQVDLCLKIATEAPQPGGVLRLVRPGETEASG